MRLSTTYTSSSGDNINLNLNILNSSRLTGVTDAALRSEIMDSFSYNAPDFFDFSKGVNYAEDVSSIEKFFETEHETHSVPVERTRESSDLMEQFSTPMKETPIRHKPARAVCIRKSISLENLSVTTDRKQKNNNDVISNRFKGACTVSQKKLTERRGCKSHFGSSDQLYKPGKADFQFRSQHNIGSNKYIPMAEAILQFHQKIPERYYSKPIRNHVVTQHAVPLKATIPQSPVLITKQRARGNVVLSTEERELKVFEEAKKQQFKAQPMNLQVFKNPFVPKSTSTKQPTKPVPFNLTVTGKHKEMPLFDPLPHKFQANPIPKAVLEPQKGCTIKSVIPTVPVTPNVLKRHKYRNDDVLLENGKSPSRNTLSSFKGEPTKLKPFSFETRDKNLKEKQAKLLDEVLVEEKKAREFHARPLPKNLYKPSSQDEEKSCIKQAHDVTGNGKSIEKQFKAKSAKVLNMQPFEPVKPHHHTTQFLEFNLNTEQQARKRELFERNKKEKEEWLVELLKQREQEGIQKEVEELKELRVLTEFRAQPVRHYKGVQQVPSKKLTSPVSPKFSRKHRNQSNGTTEEKENLDGKANDTALTF